MSNKTKNYKINFQEQELVWTKWSATVSGESQEDAQQKLNAIISRGDDPHSFICDGDIDCIKTIALVGIAEHIESDKKFILEDTESCNTLNSEIKIEELLDIKENKYYFMNDGIVTLDFGEYEKTRLYLKIEKLPTCWTHDIALTLGYSSDYMAFRKFTGLKGLLRFCNSFSKTMKIDFLNEVRV